MDDLPRISLSISEIEVRRRYHLTLSKMFIQTYGINFALLLSEIDRITHTSPEKLDEGGYLQLSYSLFERDIRISKGQAKPIVDKMIELGLLEIKYTHDGRRKFYRLNNDNVVAELKKLISKYDARKKN
ncbi:MAG: hypothetical protein HFJ02_01370 [Bacilli bacterium]|jgi:hypothetical protein|nr:hypothetical protein [Bacilli bacterium]